jgi:hypothetical protein
MTQLVRDVILRDGTALRFALLPPELVIIAVAADEVIGIAEDPVPLGGQRALWPAADDRRGHPGAAAVHARAAFRLARTTAHPAQVLARQRIPGWRLVARAHLLAVLYVVGRSRGVIEMYWPGHLFIPS